MNIGNALMVMLLVSAGALGAEPLRLHPENPRYFLFRGQPTVLIGSSEHYGSVMNLDFNYVRYLDAIKAAGLNATRIFTGQYRERPGKFGPGIDFEIVQNTLAPLADRFICPWPRTNQPGAADGGNKFDLSKWNEAYFKRLKDVVEQASRRGIVVEVSLFCPYYVPHVGDHFWEISPWNARNNINGIGNLPGADALTLQDPRLLAVQDAMVRKIVNELRDFDNVYYEICNEPWSPRVPRDWEAHIAATIAEAESSFAARHLIAQEFGFDMVGTKIRKVQKVENPVPQASVFPSHAGPEAVRLSYGVGKPLGVNETGGKTADAPYRLQAWGTLLAGGALFIGLDYSFTVGHEDGSFALPAGQPGGGSPALRRQFSILRTFMENLDFLRMAPAPSVIKEGLPTDSSAYVLADAGKSYAIYVGHGRVVKEKDGWSRTEVDATHRQLSLTLDLPAGSYLATWVNTKTGGIDKKEQFTCRGGAQVLQSPKYSEDIALRISRASGS
ncbi:MAG: hypothetical protein HY508_08115 [Acidobacteria bacterium]|nr:hypothetical protein [Acidobacteriota bacterium]